MPLLAVVTLYPSYCPSLDFVCRLVSCVATSPEARAYSAYSGWLRELHVALVCAEAGADVRKSLLDDLGRGVDWWVNGRAVAVRHEGAASLAYWNTRKADKLPAEAVVLTAHNSGAGVHLVDEAEIADKLLR
jgi:hypothetical protein